MRAWFRSSRATGSTRAYERQRESLSRAGDEARQRGLYLCVETLFGGFEGRLHVSSPARLAQELEAIAHPHVAATIDFSHSYLMLDYEGARERFVEEIAALAPYGRHLHMHDGFGRQDDILMYTEGERFADGHGDLHLPVGWGDIPWDRLMQACAFPADVTFNIELEQRYWSAAAECVRRTRDLAAHARPDARGPPIRPREP